MSLYSILTDRHVVPHHQIYHALAVLAAAVSSPDPMPDNVQVERIMPPAVVRQPSAIKSFLQALWTHPAFVDPLASGASSMEAYPGLAAIPHCDTLLIAALADDPALAIPARLFGWTTYFLIHIQSTAGASSLAFYESYNYVIRHLLTGLADLSPKPVTGYARDFMFRLALGILGTFMSPADDPLSTPVPWTTLNDPRVSYIVMSYLMQRPDDELVCTVLGGTLVHDAAWTAKVWDRAIIPDVADPEALLGMLPPDADPGKCVADMFLQSGVMDCARKWPRKLVMDLIVACHQVLSTPPLSVIWHHPTPAPAVDTHYQRFNAYGTVLESFITHVLYRHTPLASALLADQQFQVLLPDLLTTTHPGLQRTAMQWLSHHLDVVSRFSTRDALFSYSPLIENASIAMLSRFALLNSRSKVFVQTMSQHVMWVKDQVKITKSAASLTVAVHYYASFYAIGLQIGNNEAAPEDDFDSFSATQTIVHDAVFEVLGHLRKQTVSWPATAMAAGAEHAEAMGDLLLGLTKWARLKDASLSAIVFRLLHELLDVAKLRRIPLSQAGMAAVDKIATDTKGKKSPFSEQQRSALFVFVSYFAANGVGEWPAPLPMHQPPSQGRQQQQQQQQQQQYRALPPPPLPSAREPRSVTREVIDFRDDSPEPEPMPQPSAPPRAPAIQPAAAYAIQPVPQQHKQPPRASVPTYHPPLPSKSATRPATASSSSSSTAKARSAQPARPPQPSRAPTPPVLPEKLLAKPVSKEELLRMEQEKELQKKLDRAAAVEAKAAAARQAMIDKLKAGKAHENLALARVRSAAANAAARKVKLLDVQFNGVGVRSGVIGADEGLNGAIGMAPGGGRRHEKLPPPETFEGTLVQWDFFATGMVPVYKFLSAAGRPQYARVRDRYENVRAYFDAFEPLIMLETWAAMQRAKEEGIGTVVDVEVGDVTMASNVMEVKVLLPAKDCRESGIQESDVVFVTDGRIKPTDYKKKQHQKHAPPRGNGDMLLSILGVNTAPAPPSSTSDDSVAYVAKVNGVVYMRQFAEINLVVSLKARGIRPQIRLQMARAFSLVTAHREYHALTALPRMPLADEILHPRPNPVVPLDMAEVQKVMRTHRLNEPQAKAVLTALGTQGITLIQGPPGTGKTSTILGVIGAFLKKSNHILVCAPSNAAVDEITKRLLRGVRDDESGALYVPRMVRVGNADVIHPDSRSVALDDLVDEEMQRMTDVSGNVDSTWRSLLDQRAQVLADKERLEKAREEAQVAMDLERANAFDLQLKAVHIRRHEIFAQLDAHRQQRTESSRALEASRNQCRYRLLDHAQVICATLSTAGQELMTKIGRGFDVCVIDEAAQSVELSSLIPLRLGAKQCVLVGDPLQLPPTVLSSKAKELNYDQSLFVRVQEQRPENVVLLEIQYRMHPAISDFPSRMFYDSRLRNGVSADTHVAPWHSHESQMFGPIRFFDVAGRHARSNVGQSLSNVDEVDAVMYLMHNLILSHGNINFCSRIGIITMYKEQMRLIKQRVLRAYGHGALDFVDVNTVDGFQGQEKDVIIMSTVRADPAPRPVASGPGSSKSKSIGFLSDMRRMNVALTRAKYSLFIVGSAKTLVVNQYWRELIDHAKETGVLCELSNVPKVEGPCPTNLQPPDYEVKVAVAETQSRARPATSGGARKQVLPPRPPPPPPTAAMASSSVAPRAPPVPVAAAAVKRARSEGESGNLSLSAAVANSFGVGGPAGVGIVRLGPSKRANAGNAGRKS